MKDWLKKKCPKQWKIAKLILIRKGRKLEGEAARYKLICLLNFIGKAIEQHIVNRLANQSRTNYQRTNMGSDKGTLR